MKALFRQVPDFPMYWDKPGSRPDKAQLRSASTKKNAT
jgi:hypothetical protein